MKKAILVLVDGMRPDALRACGNPGVEEMLAGSTYTLEGRTVMPSVTLPCHMSLFHSVDPDRHGVTTNVYTPQVRPVEGLVERLALAEKKCAFFYTWEELRDLSRPDHLSYSLMINQHRCENTDNLITDAAIEYINREQPDFTFLSLGETDERGGHDTGWMSQTSLQVVSDALDCVQRLRRSIPGEYDVLLTADHGGHGRGHGSDCPEDMTIPLVMHGPSFEKGAVLPGASIKDIAPTIADLLGAKPAREWEGHSLLKH